ncbi:MAG: DEAD/DEAH box helicase [Simkaniaceae bacterium]|nr:DEAD/DEAH box helicase [Simkaniaceae bacterium]MCF7851928.1 DEAD/DEAH box helicase [Simkaniaceae bacterium]
MNIDFVQKADLEKGRLLLARGIPSLLFSERTYQVEVFAEEKGEATYWIFLGLDGGYRPIDYFCTCDRFEAAKSCPHVAAAYLAVYEGGTLPIHMRYKSSLWFMLFFIAARRHGFSPKLVKLPQNKGFQIKSSNQNKILFKIKANTEIGESKLKEFVFNREKETEENSIKFSNLSTEEIQHYKEGRPSLELQFELSFWSDLAKWLAVLEAQNHSYDIQFRATSDLLPTEIFVAFDDIEFSVYIAKANWPELMMVLRQTKSPLPVFDFYDFDLKKITYDPDQRALLLSKEMFHFPQKAKEVDLGEWVFRPHYGFFPKMNPPLFQGPVIEGKALAEVFRKYPILLQDKLKGESIQLDPIEPRYDLHMDASGNLHITLYAFEKGDLQAEQSHFFPPWGYLKNKGFIRWTDLMFDEGDKVIARERIADFISHYKVWLSQFEGFATHLTRMESRLIYEVTPERQLRFDVAEDFENAYQGVIDLGEWLYIRGEGFFSKNVNLVHSFLKPGMVLKGRDISSFIRSHEPELELVHQFFAEKCPVLKMGLKVSYNESGVIEVEPQVRYTTGYHEDRVMIFNEYAYVPDEGFSRIPEKALLPAGYENVKEIPTFLEQHFLFHELNDLKPYIFEIDPKLRCARQVRLFISHVDHLSESGLWKLKLCVRTEFGDASFEDLHFAVTTLKPFLASDAGLILLKEPHFDWIKTLDDKRIYKDGLKMTTMEWIRLCVYQDVEFGSSCDPQSVNALLQFKSLKMTELDKPCLVGFKTDMRPYQEIGVKWLWHLYHNHLSGILADEMGLGKTHQAMGLIAAVQNHCRQSEARFFVVCPTSVLYHWEMLLSKFLPEIKVFTYYGPQRSLDAFQGSDLFLTSYGTLRTDISKIKMIRFEVAIFDEMQSAKNKESQIHKALKALRSKMKLGLSGTPIENDLSELKALFDILLPQYFPKDEAFKEMFVLPIERFQDRLKTGLLKRLINPFILRRRKTEVLQDLPDKIEEIAYIDLSDEQHEIYRRIFEHGYIELEELETQEKPRLHLHIFALLSKLKQVCNHPCLVTKTPEQYLDHTSGKFELFKELIREARASDQKVVVFTQYLDMIKIFRLYFESMGIGYACIHGQTKDRKGEVERFRDDPSCEIFIASLQAGGVGIDLIAASVVIHYDRWWNPAKENQATDRVHRFGQTRGVQVFKLVTKGTIEERIHELIEQKKGLLQNVIGYDEEDQFKKIDPSELMQMLRDYHRETQK